MTFSVATNQIMRELVVGFDPRIVADKSPEGMADAAGLTNGFEEFDGCVVPIGYPKSKPIFSPLNPRVENSNDETGFECSLSKIHVGDFVDEETTPLLQMIRMGIAFGHQLRAALLSSRLEGPFRIIISGQLQSENVDKSCTVRFHRRRAGQRWLSDDLDEYKREALMVWDFGGRSSQTSLVDRHKQSVK